MERIIDMAKKSGCEAAEVFFRSSTSTPVEFEFGRLKQIQTVENSTLALRVIKDGKLGFATTTKLGDYQGLVDNAVATAQFGTPVAFTFAPPAAMPKVNAFERGVIDLAVEAMVETGAGMVDAIKAYEPEINVLASVTKVQTEARVITSLGLDANYRATGYEVVAGGELVEGDNFLMCYDFETSARLAADAGRVARTAIDKFLGARVNRPIAAGAYPVILTPMGLEQCFGPLLASVSGQTVEKGVSPWKDKIGQRVAAANINIYDDGTLEWASGSAPFDGEGTPRQRTPIIEAGVLRSFLLDRRTAHALKMKPTGNAGRGSDTPPGVSETIITMDAGSTTLSDMVKGIREGIIVDSLMGAWAGNPFSGHVSGNIALGYKVENGEITGRVKDCMLSINLFDVLRDRIAAISSERELKGAYLPHILIDGAGISTKA